MQWFDDTIPAQSAPAQHILTRVESAKARLKELRRLADNPGVAQAQNVFNWERHQKAQAEADKLRQVALNYQTTLENLESLLDEAETETAAAIAAESAERQRIALETEQKRIASKRGLPLALVEPSAPRERNRKPKFTVTYGMAEALVKSEQIPPSVLVHMKNGASFELAVECSQSGKRLPWR